VAVVGGTPLDLLIMAIVAATSAIVMFGLLSACVVAVMLGPRERPSFIRRNAWMFTRPESAIEWFGLGVAASIALGALLLPWSMTTYVAGADYGPLGKALLYAAYLPMAGWVAYLVRVYVTPK
jgi:hypothetical protein